MERDIIYTDAVAFPVQIERVQNPRLEDRPVIIAYPGSRSSVFALSSEARQAGLYKGMILKSAIKQYPEVVVLPPNELLYFKITCQMTRILQSLSPIVEPERYGHAFLDVTGTRRALGNPKDTATKIQKEIKSRLGLDISAGIASNKLVSKIAGITTERFEVQEVANGVEESFIAPFSVRFLPEVKRSTQEQLLEFNIEIIKQLAQISLNHLTMVFGRLGFSLHQYAHGIDNRPVKPPENATSIQEQKILREDTNDLGILSACLFMLVEKVTKRLRQSKLIARKLNLYLRYADYKEIKGQTKIPINSNLGVEIFPLVEKLLNRVLTRRVRVRILAIELFDLIPMSNQLSLFDNKSDHRTKAVYKTLDKIKARFGENAIKYAKLF